MEKPGGCGPVLAGDHPEPGMMSDMIVSGVVGEECLTHSDCVSVNCLSDIMPGSG